MAGYTVINTAEGGLPGDGPLRADFAQLAGIERSQGGGPTVDHGGSQGPNDAGIEPQLSDLVPLRHLWMARGQP